MEFRILGPLEVLVNGDPVSLGGPRPRSVLAVLALHPNHVVSRDRLIDEIWGESPPETAQTALQVHVSQLRKVLGADRIETRPPGYRLRLEPKELDVDRFDQLVREARGASAAEAAEWLREALDLWRGPPLADLDDMLARPERARLDEERLSALELRVAADLDLGRHVELIPELEGIVREHPLRERLRGQLMVALYRSGRQADALDVYRTGQRLLDEELGLQPGEELRRLERAILEQDPALASPAAADVVLGAEERRGRLFRLSRVVAVTGTVVLAGTIAALLVVLSRPGGGVTTVPPSSLAVVDPDSGNVVATVPVGARPVAVAAGEGGIWVANADDGTVSRIDPDTRRVVATIGIGSPASDIAAGAGSVWVANGSEGTVSRIDPGTNAVVDTIDLSGPDELVPAGVYCLTVGFGSVWIGSGQGKVFRLQPNTGAITTLAIDRTPADIAAGDGAVWVVTLEGRTLRIDPRTDAVTGEAPASSLPFPLSVAAGAGSVWVGDPGGPTGTGTVWRIDSATVTVTGTTPVHAVPRAIATTPSAVWVAGGASGTLVKLHPRSGRVLTTIRLGNAPLDVAAGGGGIWVPVGSDEAST